MVSNAANKSSAITMAERPESMALWMSSVILSNTASVECLRRYADCNGLKFGEDVTCGTLRARNKRSKILLMVLKLDIGR